MNTWMPRPAVLVRRLAIGLATGLALAACAGAPGDQPTSSDPEDATAADQSPPSALVGLWKVEADGLETETWIQIGSPFGPQDLTVHAGDCVHSGIWRALDGVFLSDASSSSGTCADLALPWLSDAAGYTATDDGMSLMDSSGASVASLTIDGAPPQNPDVAEEYREQPELDPDQQEALDAMPEPLPDGVDAATVDDLLGRWIPTTSYETDPFLELATDGSWTGSDGCNGQSGVWAMTDSGVVLATSGVQTLIGCEGEGLGSMLAGASRVGIDGDLLTFYDAGGQEIGQAERA